MILDVLSNTLIYHNTLWRDWPPNSRVNCIATSGGAAFTWTEGEGKPVAGSTIWSIGSAQGDHFAPSTATFMVNYRVEDLHALVKVLREEGCNVLEKIDESEYGKFAWVIDPEGNKVELWQPPAGQ
jgi:predicted enzyme related to lactoylglutathione lyase